VLEFIKKTLDPSNPASFGRTFTIPTLVTSCFTIVYLSIHNGHAPDAGVIAALGAFGVAPYGVSKTGETVQKFSNGNGS